MKPELRRWVAALCVTALALPPLPFMGEALAAVQANSLNNTVSDALICNGHPWIDVRCYGAVGNDTADDTAALNTAFTDAVTNHVPLRLSNGTFKVTAKLSWDLQGSASAGLKIISDNATIDGVSIGGAGNVLQLFGSGGTPGSPTVVNNLDLEGVLTVKGSTTGYVVDLGTTNFADEFYGAHIDHLVVTNASTSGTAGGVRGNFFAASRLNLDGTTAGGGASVSGVALEQLQNSTLSGHGKTAGASGAALLIENGTSQGNSIAGFDYDPASNTCLSVTSTTAANNMAMSPYFGCTTAVNATQNYNGVTVVNPTFAGANLGPSSQGVAILGRDRYNASVTSTYTASGADNGTIFSSTAASGASITITVPNPATVKAGYRLMFTTDGGKGLNVTPAAGTVNAGNISLSTLALGPFNYEFAEIESDGTNYRLVKASPGTRRANGIDSGQFPGYRWESPAGPGYQTTVADNGQTVSADATGSGLSLTLPQRSTLHAGWSITIDAKTQPFTIHTYGPDADGTIYFVGSNGAGIPLPYSFGTGSAVITYDGSGFRLIPLNGAASVSTRVAVSGTATTDASYCGRAIGLNGAGVWTTSIGNPASAPPNCAIDIENENATPEKIAVNGGITDFIYPNQVWHLYNRNSTWYVDRPKRYQINSTAGAPLTLYYDPVAGSDSNDGFAAGAGRALASANACLARIWNDFDFRHSIATGVDGANQSVVICHQADNTTETGGVHFPPHGVDGAQGGAAVQIEGGTNSTISTTGVPAIDCYFSQLQIQNLTLQTAGAQPLIKADRHCDLIISGAMVFNGSAGGAADIFVREASEVIIQSTTTIAINGVAGLHELVQFGGTILDAGTTTINAAITTTTGFVFAGTGGSIDMTTNPTFTIGTGSVTGPKFGTGFGGSIQAPSGKTPNDILPGTTNGISVYDPSGLTLAASGSNPTNPATPATSAGFTMMGVGSTCTFTPNIQTTVRVTMSGNASNDTAGDGVILSLRYGTGTPPAAGAAVTGTRPAGVSTSMSVGGNNGTNSFAGEVYAFNMSGLAVSLVPGVPVWFDIAAQSQRGGNSTVQNLGCSWQESP